MGKANDADQSWTMISAQDTVLSHNNGRDTEIKVVRMNRPASLILKGLYETATCLCSQRHLLIVEPKQGDERKNVL